MGLNVTLGTNRTNRNETTRTFLVYHIKCLKYHLYALDWDGPSRTPTVLTKLKLYNYSNNWLKFLT